MIRVPAAPSSHPALLRAAHPCPMGHWSASPTLLHGRRHRLVASWSSRPPAPSDDAAENGKEEKSAYAGGDADYQFLVVVDPAANFLGC